VKETRLKNPVFEGFLAIEHDEEEEGWWTL
jgi:hypothetical protein